MQQINNQLMQQAVNPPQKNTKRSFDHSNVTVDLEGQQVSLMDWVQIMMLEAFDRKWPHHNGLPSIWKLKIGTMSVDQVKKAVWVCCEDDWPPSVGQFVQAGKDTGFDYDESFNRFLTLPKSKLSDVEYFAATDVEGNKCRTEYDDKRARKVWKRLIDKYEQRRVDGSLPSREQKAIATTKSESKGSWRAPDGEFYTCPAEYWAKVNGLGK